MRAKSIFLLIVALGSGMVAAVAVSKTMMEREPQQLAEASIEILVANREIKTAQVIAADSVRLERWPRSRVPEGIITDFALVDGKYARQGIFPGEPILIPKLADSNSSLSTQIPAGHTLFNITFDNNYIRPGDIVDISGIFQCNKTKRTEVKSVLSEVQVFAINGISDRDFDHKGGRNTVFQLLIEQSQNQALMLANNLGKLELNLRPLASHGGVKSGKDDGQAFLEWALENSSEPVKDEPPKSGQLVGAPNRDSLTEKPPKNEILIVTPEGVTRYEFVGDEMPKIAKGDDFPQIQNSAPNPWGYYSGVGGYTPTYPNGTVNSLPARPEGFNTESGVREGSVVGEATQSPPAKEPLKD